MTRAKKTLSFVEAAHAAMASETVELAELGLVVTIRPMSWGGMLGAQKFATAAGGAVDTDNLVLAIVAGSVFDQAGKRLIPEGHEADVSALPAGIMTKIVPLVLKVNGMETEETENA